MSDEEGAGDVAGGAGKGRTVDWPDAAEWLASRGLAADRAVPILADLLSSEFADGEPSHYDAEMWLVHKINLLKGYGAGAAPAASVLIEGLGNRNWQIRAKAAEALGRIGPAASAAAPALRELLRGFDPSNRLSIWNQLRYAESLWRIARDSSADLDPAPGGTVGQIILFDHETGPRRVLAPSFAEWLARLARALEAGKLAWHPVNTQVEPLGYSEPGGYLKNWEADWT